jgi:hypothetical protein
LTEEIKAMQDTSATKSKPLISIEELTPDEQQILMQNRPDKSGSH